MAGVQAIQGVDDTLRELSKNAVATLAVKPKITIGPLDGTDDELRLNWFLYRVSPSHAHRNMEPPQSGWRSARGRPPLALRLSYLLSAFAAKASGGGDHEQFAHAGLVAVMRELHDHAILATGAPVLSPLAEPLVEPLRITLEDLDVETITKLWSAATTPLRLSIGYEVSLVVVETDEPHRAGPPVRTRGIAVSPSIGVRLVSAEPARAWRGIDISVAVQNRTAGTTFTLAREALDPPGTDDWPMITVAGAPPGTVSLALPEAGLAPGPRRLQAASRQAGLPTGQDSIGLTIVPVVTGPATPLARGVPVTLQTAHAAPDVEVFVAGRAIAPAHTAFVSPTEVRITIPATTPPGPAEVLLRAGRVAGEPMTIELAP